MATAVAQADLPCTPSLLGSCAVVRSTVCTLNVAAGAMLGWRAGVGGWSLQSLAIAGDLCIYTNQNHVIEVLGGKPAA